MRIVLDYGHSETKDFGAVYNGIKESKLNFQIGKKINTLLKTLKYDVIETRTTSEYISLADRVEIENRGKFDVFISIHCNAAQNNIVRGYETHYNTNSYLGYSLAKFIQVSLHKELKDIDRGIKESEFYVLRKTKAIACLIECGFMSNPDELIKLSDDSYQWQVANAVVRGIENYRKWREKQ